MNTPKDIIRGNGLRVTPARIAVLKTLENSEKPMDINAIISRVEALKVDCDQATIYRIIENFVEKNLIIRLQFQEKKFYYEFKRMDHHHVICENCGEITDIFRCFMKRSERTVEEKYGFKVKSHALEFFGLCPNCQK